MYALSNLIDGQPPSYRAVDGTYDAQAGEIVVTNIPQDAVWDAALGMLRSKTDAEKLAENLQEAKAAKKREMQQAFSSALAGGHTCSNGIKMNAYEYDIRKLDDGSRLAARLGNATLTVRDFGNDRHVILLADVNAMVNELGANYQALLQRYWDCDDAIQAAITDEEVNAVIW